MLLLFPKGFGGLLLLLFPKGFDGWLLNGFGGLLLLLFPNGFDGLLLLLELILSNDGKSLLPPSNGLALPL